MRKHPSYYVVCIDYGKRGLEAIVHPELTKRAIIEMVASEEAKNICFIHHIDGGHVEDVTADIFDAAQIYAQMREAV